MDCSTPKLPCPSLSPRVCSSSSPLSWWCHPTISYSFTSFSSCPQSFPALGSFPMSQLFASGGQSIGASASASVLPLNIQGWFPLGLTGLVSLQSKGLSRVFSSITLQKHHFFGAWITPRSQYKLLKVCIVSCSGLFVQKYFLNTYYVLAILLDTWKNTADWRLLTCVGITQRSGGAWEPQLRTESEGEKVRWECVLASGWAAWFREDCRQKRSLSAWLPPTSLGPLTYRQGFPNHFLT